MTEDVGLTNKHEKNRGVDTFGRPIVSHVVLIEKRYEEYMSTIQSIKDYLVAKDLSSQSASWERKRFAYMCIKPYGKKTSKELIPAEFCIVVFSFDEGILEVHGGFIDPGEIPLGEQGEVRLSCVINGYPYPGENQTEVSKLMPVITPIKFMETITMLSNKYGLFMDQNFLFFACRKDVAMTKCCVKWIAVKTGSSVPEFRLVSFEILLMEMSQLVNDPVNTVGVINHEGGAAKFIYSPRYDYDLKLACGWHQYGLAAEKLDHCTQNISLRRVYNALFYLCHLFEREIPLDTHRPPNDKCYGSK